MGEREFSTTDHPLALREERRDKKNWDDINEVKLKGIVEDLKAPDHRLILCSKTHRVLAERTGYYGNWYSTSGHGIL